MEHGLGRVELGNWWKNTTSIAGKKDDIAGVVGGKARDLGVGNVLDRIGTGLGLVLPMRWRCEILTYHRVFSVRVASS